MAGSRVQPIARNRQRTSGMEVKWSSSTQSINTARDSRKILIKVVYVERKPLSSSESFRKQANIETIATTVHSVTNCFLILFFPSPQL